MFNQDYCDNTNVKKRKYKEKKMNIIEADKRTFFVNDYSDPSNQYSSSVTDGVGCEIGFNSHDECRVFCAVTDMSGKDDCIDDYVDTFVADYAAGKYADVLDYLNKNLYRVVDETINAITAELIFLKDFKHSANAMAIASIADNIKRLVQTLDIATK